MFAVGSLSSPFALPNDISHHGVTRFSATGKVLTASPGLVPGEDTLVLVIPGQSLVGNMGTASYTPTHQTKIDNLSIIDGAMYQAIDPLIGCTDADGGTYLVRMADKLISAGRYDRVVLVPLAVGGTSVAEWARGGICNDRLMVAVRRLAAFGMTPSAFWWDQGQADVVGGTTQATYDLLLRDVIATVRDQGVMAPWYICKDTWDGSTSNANIRAAQAGVVNGTDIFLGADIDTISNTDRYDTVHLNATGCDAAATLGAAIL